jgi:hypothetical protein
VIASISESPFVQRFVEFRRQTFEDNAGVLALRRPVRSGFLLPASGFWKPGRLFKTWVLVVNSTYRLFPRQIDFANEKSGCEM